MVWSQMSGCLLAAWRHSEYAHSVFNSCLCVHVWKEAQRETLNDEVWVYAPFARSRHHFIQTRTLLNVWMNSWSRKLHGNDRSHSPSQVLPPQSSAWRAVALAWKQLQASILCRVRPDSVFFGVSLHQLLTLACSTSEHVCVLLHLCGVCVQSLEECESTFTFPVKGCVSSLLLLIISAVKLVPDTHSRPLLSRPFVRVKGRIQVSGSQRRIHPRIHPIYSSKHTYMRIHGSSRLEKPEF